jgi:hypothetical protein
MVAGSGTGRHLDRTNQIQNTTPEVQNGLGTETANCEAQLV